jgi:diaminopimelate epimerase
MSQVRFTKVYSAGNDFLIVPDPDDTFRLDADRAESLCDRDTGVGADGIIRVAPTASVAGHEVDAVVAPWFMDYRNADGSLGGTCGNGLRVFARHLVDSGLAQAGEFAVATRAGVHTVWVPEDGDVTVDMGVPIFGDQNARVRVADEWLDSVNVDMGNPHAVVLLEDVAQAGPLHRAPEYEPASVYPGGVTFDFVASLEPRRLRVRVYEHGVGETYSCGTGACAAVITVARRDQAPGNARYVVETLGGHLDVALAPDGRMKLTGPTLMIMDDTWRDPEWTPGPCVEGH